MEKFKIKYKEILYNERHGDIKKYDRTSERDDREKSFLKENQPDYYYAERGLAEIREILDERIQEMAQSDPKKEIDIYIKEIIDCILCFYFEELKDKENSNGK